MAFELLNLGTTANDGTGDSLRQAGAKINAVITYLNGGSAERFDSINSDKVATANSLLLADTSSNTITVTLPTISSLTDPVGVFVKVLDVANTFGTNNVTITAPDGERIHRALADYTLSTNEQHVTLTYSGATFGWIVTDGV